MGARGDLASYVSRVGATLIDGLVIGVVAVVAAVIAGAAGASADSTSVVIVVAALLGSLIYAPVLMCRSGAHHGQTLGKQALSIRVVRADAEAIGASTAILREFVGKGLLGLIPFYTVVDYLFPLGDARRQAIHDKLASTFVVRADAVPDLGPATPDAFGTIHPERPAAPSGWAPPSAPPPSSAPASRGSEWAPPAPPAPLPPPSSPEEDEPRGPFGPSSSQLR